MTSVDAEGTGNGADIDLINSVAKEVNIPLIVHGGVGNVDHIIDIVASTKASAVALSSILHYEAISKVTEGITHPESEGNREFLSSNRIVKHIDATTIKIIKQKLSEFGLEVRL